MDIVDIEQLVSIIRDARISELVVETGDEQRTKIRLRKPLPSTPRAEASSTKTAATSSAPAKPTVDAGMYITAPMVGIFHGMETLSCVGAPIRTGRAVGSIESLKLMNDIIAEHDGVIAEVLVEDGMPVMYGQNLFRIAKS